MLQGSVGKFLEPYKQVSGVTISGVIGPYNYSDGAHLVDIHTKFSPKITDGEDMTRPKIPTKCRLQKIGSTLLPLLRSNKWQIQISDLKGFPTKNEQKNLTGNCCNKVGLGWVFTFKKIYIYNIYNQKIP